MRKPKHVYRNLWFNFGIAPKEEIDDFILFPVPACGYVLGSDKKSWGCHVSIKFGFWGIYLAIYFKAGSK